MKKIILISCLLLIALTNFAQGQYIQGKIDQIPADGFELKPIFTPKNVSDEPYDFQKELSEFTLAFVPLPTFNQRWTNKFYYVHTDI